MGFAGLAFTDHTQIQMLGEPIHFDYHPTDIKLCRTAARYLGAWQKATNSLKWYCEADIPRLWLPSTSDPYVESRHISPCYRAYTSLQTSKPHAVVYSSQPFAIKLIFTGRSEGVEVCVKFVTQYSKAAHQHAASLGIAPILRGFEMLPGGWFMVVMDLIKADFVTLQDLGSPPSAGLKEAMKHKLVLLHQGTFVHGDLWERKRDG